jgi:hypothetical protein
MSTLLGEITPTGTFRMPRRSLLIFDNAVVHSRTKGVPDLIRTARADPDVWDPAALASRDRDSWIVPMDAITSVLLRRRVKWWLAVMTLGLAAFSPDQRCLTISHTSGRRHVSWSVAEDMAPADRYIVPLLREAFGDRFVYDHRLHLRPWPPETG